MEWIDASTTEGEDVADGVVSAFHTRSFFTDLGDETVDVVFPEGVAVGLCRGGWFFQYPAQVFLFNSFMNAFMKAMRLSFFGCWSIRLHVVWSNRLDELGSRWAPCRNGMISGVFSFFVRISQISLFF
jgi:hypothetical protein